MRLFILYFFGSILFVSCNNQQEQTKVLKQQKVEQEYRAKIKYAKWFEIEYFTDYKIITTYNPWDNKHIFAKYYVYYNDSNFNPIYNKLNIIKNNVVALSESQIGFLKELGLSNKITGISQKEYVYDKSIVNKALKNKIAEIGTLSYLNLEQLLKINPEIVFATGWQNTSNLFSKIINANIPVVFLLEWQEQNPLGRAEWIKFIAAFFNMEKKADSIFNNVEIKYNALKSKKYQLKPTILHSSLINGIWYVPGGNSYVANLYSDAGAYYFWKDDNTGSLPLKFESVYKKAKNADFWFPFVNIKKIEDLVQIEKRYNLFKAVENKNIILSNKRISQYGGNDYWESGVVHPEIILNDLISIFHKNERQKLYYFKFIDYHNPKN